MKYKSTKEYTTSDWGKMALTGILAGGISQFTSGILWKTILDIAGLLGFICLFIWIYRKLKKI